MTKYSGEKVILYIVDYLARKEVDPNRTRKMYAHEKNIPSRTLNSWLTGARRPEARNSLTDQQRAMIDADVRLCGQCTTGSAAASIGTHSSKVESSGSQPSTRGESQATVDQIAVALAALGGNGEKNFPEKVEEVAARHGSADAHRALMINALLGVVQAQAMMADGMELDMDARQTSWEEQFEAVGAGLEDPALRILFIRWQVLRVVAPIQRMAEDRGVGPIPLAAAQAAIGLHLLFGVITASQNAVAHGNIEDLIEQSQTMEAARNSLQSAVENTDPLLDMLRSVGLHDGY